MASYTEYFYEYIENGNEMPSVFDSIATISGNGTKSVTVTIDTTASVDR